MKLIDRFILTIFAAPFALVIAIIALITVISLWGAISFKLGFYTNPEQYTSLVPPYLKASKPIPLVDTTNFMGGGYIVIQMQISNDIAEKISRNPKALGGQWELSPISEGQMTASKKAEFLQFVRQDNDECSGCSHINDAATNKGSYYMVPNWPGTGRIGVLLVPATKKVYYIQSGN